MTTTTLPRAYWCHTDLVASRDHRAPDASEAPESVTLSEAYGAVEWVREHARAVSWQMSREEFHAMFAWLGHHRCRDAATDALRRGCPYSYSVTTPAGRWTWTARPVRVLPLVRTEPALVLSSATRGDAG